MGQEGKKESRLMEGKKQEEERESGASIYRE